VFRHDPVYYSRFKLNKAYLWEYPSVWRWMGTMIGTVPGVAECATKSILQHCKQVLGAVSRFSASCHSMLTAGLFWTAWKQHNSYRTRRLPRVLSSATTISEEASLVTTTATWATQCTLLIRRAMCKHSHQPSSKLVLLLSSSFAVAGKSVNNQLFLLLASMISTPSRC
jgi:hypothetical protein